MAAEQCARKSIVTPPTLVAEPLPHFQILRGDLDSIPVRLVRVRDVQDELDATLGANIAVGEVALAVRRLHKSARGAHEQGTNIGPAWRSQFDGLWHFAA
jgi:hypothetical protein